MNILTVIVIAVALVMDAFAVSVTTGASYKKLGSNHVFKIAFAFGRYYKCSTGTYNFVAMSSNTPGGVRIFEWGAGKSLTAQGAE